MQPKLLDFGISKQAGAAPNLALTGTGTLLGTPYYMAPEQAAGARHADSRSDQYSLGVILYECATARRPFPGETLYRVLHGIVEGVFERPRTHRPELPERFEQLILRAMAKDPDARFDSVHSLGHALLEFASPSVRAVWERVFDKPLGVASTALSQPVFISRPSISKGSGSNPNSELPTASTISRSVFELSAPRESTSAGTGASRRAIVIGAALFTMIAIGGLALRSRSPAAPPASPLRAAIDPTMYRASVRVSPAIATVELDGEPVGRGHVQRDFPRDGVEHTLRIGADGYESRTVTFRDEPPSAFIELSHAHAAVTAEPAITPPVAPNAGTVATVAPGAATHGGHRGHVPRPQPVVEPVAPQRPPTRHANGAPIMY
jgi:hypothetical protein